MTSARAAPLRTAETWSGVRSMCSREGRGRKAQPQRSGCRWGAAGTVAPGTGLPRLPSRASSAAPVGSEGYRAGPPSPWTVPVVGVANGSQGSDCRRLSMGSAGATENVCPHRWALAQGPITMVLGAGACGWLVTGVQGLMFSPQVDPALMGGGSAVLPSGGSLGTVSLGTVALVTSTCCCTAPC